MRFSLIRHSRPFRRALLPAAAFLTLACSDEAPDGTKVPIAGGTVTADSARLTLVIPNGALSGDTYIDVQRGAAPSDPTLVGDRSYEITPEGLRLSQPATVTLRPAGALPTGTAREEIAVAVSVNGTVTEVPATVDAAAGTVTAQLSTLGDVWVRRLHVARVTVDRASATLDATKTLQLSAAALAESGRTLASPAITWASDNQGVALVGPTGLVQALAPGTARITARSEGREATVTILVVRRTVTSIHIAPPAALFPGQTVTLAATLRDSVGAPIERAPSWSSRNPDVATVTAGGILTAVAPGTATIEASADGTINSVLVTVRPTPVRILGVRSLATGEAVDLTAISGGVAVDVEVNPERPARSFRLLLSCPNRPDVTVVTYDQQIIATSQFTFALQTAEFDPTTGIVRTPNGACQLRGQLEYVIGEPSTVGFIGVTLANTSRFVARPRVTDDRTAVLGIAPVARALGTDTFEHQAGSVSLELLAVNYTPNALVTSIGGTYLGRTFTGVAPVAGTQRFVLEFPNVPPTGNDLGIGGYTSPTGGDVPVLTAVAVSSGTPFTTMEGPVLRIDNAPPRAPAYFTLAGATTSGGTLWVPSAYVFNRPEVYGAVGDTTGGVGGAQVLFYGQRAAEAGLTNGTGTGAQCAVGTIVRVTTAGDLLVLRPAGGTAAPNEFRLRAVEHDRLGNIRCTDLSTPFGVTAAP
ncbi:MAG TPA: Ig-like domain-containing protein [Gemmatimonadaceae bacterium]|nr:Ig-like domain-containing protein [Gemmatimonadaceae bacterium]